MEFLIKAIVFLPLIAALIADLFILRPTAMWLISTSHRIKAAWGSK